MRRPKPSTLSIRSFRPFKLWATLPSGKTCAGTWAKGEKDGRPREVYIYQVADNERCMKEYAVQAVVWQTAVNPVIALELLHEGVWQGSGVLGPEAFDPDPFVDRMAAFDFPYGIRDRTLVSA